MSVPAGSVPSATDALADLLNALGLQANEVESLQIDSSGITANVVRRFNDGGLHTGPEPFAVSMRWTLDQSRLSEATRPKMPGTNPSPAAK